ncbi:MAG: carbohydrate kinase family protein [Candidatus Bathyarchaeota archaeon]|nr:carbohydrate kinase family protein [Candidatus Bathyarchaeota archaeon]
MQAQYMTDTHFKKELVSFLKSDKNVRPRVVVMPDYFQDRLIDIPFDVTHFTQLIANVANRKGGSIDGITQTDLRGGNAVNTASALAALGAEVVLIVCTSQIGFQRLKLSLGKCNIDLSHVKIADKASLTTALELSARHGKSNVMLRDLGSLADFGPSNLSENDYRIIENADYVCIFNWAGTRQYGTQLAEAVFDRTKTKGKGKTYYDTADPTPNKEKIPELIQKVLKTAKVDILSLNENEAICYASLFSEEIKRNKQNLGFEALAIKAAGTLAEHLSARVDLHTTALAASIAKKKKIMVPALNVQTLRATGAGDAWNAGNIIGDAAGVSDECRLALANAVAAYYLTSPDGEHPTKQMLIKFIEGAWQE